MLGQSTMTDRTIREIEANDLAETPYDASDPEQVNKQRVKAGRRKTKRLEVIKALMSHKDGREWIYELLERGHIYHTSFVQGDSHASAFKEGERNITNQLLIDVTSAAPEEYLMMLKEAKE